MNVKQATVSAYDADGRSGRVLTDAGVELTFDEAALSTGNVRLLRPGQRVWLQLSGTNEVAAVSIIRPSAGAPGPQA